MVLGAALAPASAQDPAALSQSARDLMAAGKFSEAAELYRKLVSAVPGNAGLQLNLGMALHMAGRDAEAVPELQKALRLDSSAWPAALFLGASHLRLGEPRKAIAPLEQVAAAQPNHAEALQMLAEAYFSLERFEEAARYFGRLARLTPGNARAWFTLGRSYEALAGEAFDALEKAAPESAYFLALVAETRLTQQQYNSAFFLYRQAQERMPAMRGLHAAIGEIYRKTDHPEWAKVEEEKERALPPPDCGEEKLECMFREGRYAEVISASRDAKSPQELFWRVKAYNGLAVQAFSKLADLPPSAEVHAFRAELHRNQRRPREAVEEWRRALEFAPGDPGLRQDLAISLREVGDNEAALEIFRDLLRHQPLSALLNYLVGDTLLDLQRAEEAVAYLEKAAAQDPELLSARSSLGRAYMQTGRGDRAVPHLKAALPLDEDGSLHYQLALAYQRSGEQDLARQLLQEYRRIQDELARQRKTFVREVQIAPPE
jgi:tetratricopeptide (TPR) repeat protein